MGYAGDDDSDAVQHALDANFLNPTAGLDICAEEDGRESVGALDVEVDVTRGSQSGKIGGESDDGVECMLVA